MSQMSVNMEICDGMNLVERAIKKGLDTISKCLMLFYSICVKEKRGAAKLIAAPEFLPLLSAMPSLPWQYPSPASCCAVSLPHGAMLPPHGFHRSHSAIR